MFSTALLSFYTQSIASPIVPTGDFQTYASGAQAIDIERTIGDGRPEKMLICIDGRKVGVLRKGDRIRVFLTATRTHDVYLVTRGVTTCDVNQVVTVLEIPSDKQIWQVGIEHDDTVKLLHGVSR